MRRELRAARQLVWLVLGCALPYSWGCAEGAAPEPITLTNGMYDLVTMRLDGNCTLDGALTPGAEHMGKVARVSVDVSDRSLTIEACDPFFDDCFATVGDPITLLRSGDQILADEPNWEVTACTCFDDYRAERSVDGRIVANDQAELTWSFTIPAPPAGCMCDGWSACQATLEQQLVRP